MKRLLRILLNAITALSLLLCLAIVGLWVRSRTISDDYWTARSGGTLFHAEASDGQMHLQWVWPWFYDEPLQHRTVPHNDRAPGLSFGNEDVDYHERWGVTWQHGLATYATDPLTNRPYTATGEFAGEQVFDGGGEVKGLNYRAVSFGLLQLASLLSIVPVVRATRMIMRVIYHRLRHKTGHCPTCGYDLRATPDRCPECGAVPKNPQGISG